MSEVYSEFIFELGDCSEILQFLEADTLRHAPDASPISAWSFFDFDDASLFTRPVVIYIAITYKSNYK